MTKYRHFTYYYKFLAWILLILGFNFTLYGQTTESLGNKAYISQQSFSMDHAIQSLFSETSETFQIEDWNVSEAILELDLSTTQLVDPALSTLSIALNDVSIYAEKLQVTDGSTRTLNLSLPTKYLKNGTNTIIIRTYIRTIEGLPCVDDVSSGNWMNIFSDSNVSLKYTLTSKINSIRDFYTVFTSRAAMDYDQSCVAVNTNAPSSDLNAGLLGIAYLSANATYNKEHIQFLDINNETDLKDKQYIVYISTYNDLLPVYKDLLSKVEREDAQKGALIKLLKSNKQQDILLLTANDNALLINAAKLLGYSEVMKQLMTSSKYIAPTDNVLMPSDNVETYYPLTTTGTTVHGLFRQTANFYINFPANRMIAGGSEVYLHLRYSDNLNFNRALVTVFINDVPIGSKSLSSDLANKDTFTLEIPTNLDVSGNFNLKVAFDLELTDSWCTLRQGEMPWGYVSPESMLKLNTIDVPYLLFDHYPCPFIKDGGFSNDIVLIPDNLTKSDYTVMGEIFRTLGSFLRTNLGTLEVKKVSDPYDLTDKNIIAIGTYNNHSYISSLNDKLFFKFSEDGRFILSNEKLMLDPTYGSTLGTCQLLRTSDNEKSFGILVVTGATEQGLLDAAKYLSSEKGLWNLYGDGYIAANEDLSCYRFKVDNTKTISFISKVTDQKDIQIFLMIIGMLIVFLILSSLLLLNKYRKRGKHEQ